MDTVGEILKEKFMNPTGMSGYRLAKEMNVPVSRVQDILGGRRKISADTSVRLGRVFGKPDDYFLNLQNSVSVRQIKQDNVPDAYTGRSHLDALEAEAIYIMREVAAECEKPVMLYSIGKDSSVMLHLAMKAFYPEKPPFPFLHVNTTWKFKEMIEFRDKRASELGIEMLEYINEEGLKQGINPFDHGAAYTDVMKTQALKQALDKYGFTAAFGGGRRDEEKSRAKERIFSFRNESHAWEPKSQRPEMWKCYNIEIKKGESIRVFPISNWTESDIWQYIKRENIPIVPLYFAAKRPVVERDGNLIMVDDDRMRLLPGEKPEMKMVRFRTLGCYPLSGGVESNATTIDEVIEETLSAAESERTSRVIDRDGGAASMEKRKREGYF
ncbi:MAG: sulfate adenylyltransferase subunit CysD [Lachnospiraceae bacterium]|nr:sulfate adenylyltransferase subunit CysD [Lachnospiraceae bacterium]